MDNECAVIIGAADINYSEVIEELNKITVGFDLFAIYCDRGLRHEKMLGIEANLIVGDFDSYANPKRTVETIVLPRAKDDTDTVYAVKEAIKRGFSMVLLIGVIGRRFDHSMGNVSALYYLYERNIQARIIDDYSDMMVVGKDKVTIDDSVKYFSLLAMTGSARGIHIENAKFELDGGTINPDYQYGISNETISGKKSVVWCEEGKLLLVRIRND